MKYVITGALGHIGSSLLRESQEMRNSEIVMIDNLSSQRYSSLFGLSNSKKFRFLENDIQDTDLDKILDIGDIVIHLAAITDAASSFKKADLVEKNNFGITERIVNSCVRKKSKLIFISSTSVYGTQKDMVFEDCDLSDLKPQSPYAETKLKEEDLITKSIEQSGLEATIYRFGTIYGVSPGMRFQTAVNKFCWQAVMSQPLTIWSTAYEQKRPYLYLTDAIRAIDFIIKRNLFSGQIYNVLTENLTVKDIVDNIKGFIEEVEVSFIDSEIMNQLSYEVSNEKIISEGFGFKGNIKDGISETINLLCASNSKLIES